MINNVCNRFLFQLITITLSVFLLTEVSARPSRKANAHSKPSPTSSMEVKVILQKDAIFEVDSVAQSLPSLFIVGLERRKVSLTTEGALVTSPNVKEAVLPKEKVLVVYVRSSKLQGTV